MVSRAGLLSSSCILRYRASTEKLNEIALMHMGMQESGFVIPSNRSTESMLQNGRVG